MYNEEEKIKYFYFNMNTKKYCEGLRILFEEVGKGGTFVAWVNIEKGFICYGGGRSNEVLSITERTLRVQVALYAKDNRKEFGGWTSGGMTLQEHDA